KQNVVAVMAPCNVAAECNATASRLCDQGVHSRGDCGDGDPSERDRRAGWIPQDKSEERLLCHRDIGVSPHLRYERAVRPVEDRIESIAHIHDATNRPRIAGVTKLLCRGAVTVVADAAREN